MLSQFTYAWHTCCGEDTVSAGADCEKAVAVLYITFLRTSTKVGRCLPLMIDEHA